MDDSSSICVKIPLVWNTPICDRCGHPADIFQDEGEFCCSCWTKRTEPYVTPIFHSQTQSSVDTFEGQ